jgi:uncharacterized protein (TIGR02270 family)
MAAVSAAARSPRILWEVLEEHFEEGAYGLVCFRRALESPYRTLSDLARYPEERLIAQVDALLLAGAAGSTRLLEPALAAASEEDDELEPERVELAAWTLIDAGSFSMLEASLCDPRAKVQSALIGAARHARNPAFSGWLTQKLQHAAADGPVAALLALAAARQLGTLELMAALQSTDPRVQIGAALAARYGEPAKLHGVMQYLLEHEQPAVRDAALLASLAWGSQVAWLHCKRWALDPLQPSPLATLLCAALGTRGDHELLLPLLGDASTKQALLFALGFSGNTALYPALVPFLEGPDALDARLAAQSLGLIFGFAPASDEFALPPPVRVERSTLPPAEDDPEAGEALPALENDDLDADLVPRPEEDLPAPNVAAIKRHCEERAKLLGTKARVLYGQPFNLEQVGNVLAKVPLRVRHGVALALGVRSGGSLWLDTRAPSALQRAQMSRIGTVSLRRFSGF